MIFPFALVPGLDALLAARSDHSAILMDDRRAEVGRLIPLAHSGREEMGLVQMSANQSVEPTGPSRRSRTRDAAASGVPSRSHVPGLGQEWAAMRPKRTGNSIKWSLKSATAFLIVASASLVEAQTLQTLCSFNGTNGANPNALTLGNDGNFYGTTWIGGSRTNLPYLNGVGTVFKVTTNGTLTTLVSFNSTNGAAPYAG